MKTRSTFSLYSSRRHFTLLELIISLSLTMVILTTLTYFYQQVNVINAKMDQAQNESFQKRYVENRLATILPKTVSSTDPANQFHFFSSPDPGDLFKSGSFSLVFTFDNCVNLNKEMAYHVIGRLYLDDKGNFTLAKWPTEKRWKENEPVPISKEILLENVETLDFLFLIPPKKGKAKDEGELTLGPEKKWEREWKKEYRQLPAIVKIVLKRRLDNKEEETLTFAFPLPHTQHPIIYDQ
ncbi:MAG: hypothetical protein K940chlam7_00378 [Chlamydiae bacterium]|nr:hypothetical protein [Chlamydiota bacterium]